MNVPTPASPPIVFPGATLAVYLLSQVVGMAFERPPTPAYARFVKSNPPSRLVVLETVVHLVATACLLVAESQQWPHLALAEVALVVDQLRNTPLEHAAYPWLLVDLDLLALALAAALLYVAPYYGAVLLLKSLLGLPAFFRAIKWARYTRRRGGVSYWLLSTNKK